MNENNTHLELIRRYLDGTATAEETQTLEALILRDPAVRREFLRYAHLDAALAGNLRPTLSEGVLPSDRQIAQASVKPRSRWLSWRPLAAAAAGIVLGMFCTSVVLAYVRPALEKTITLLKDDFESGAAPLVTGVPIEPGRWSGDYTEVVETQQGVQPGDGKKMLRFLRADYEGKPEPEGSHTADIYRLMDLRPYREQFADGGAVVQFSAQFNAFAFPKGDAYLCKMSLHAYDAQTVAGGPLRVDDTRDGDDLAETRAGRMKLDRDPATWQRVTCDLRLPANTDFLLVHLAIQHSRGKSRGGTFAGHYLDDARLTMTRRPPSR